MGHSEVCQPPLPLPGPSRQQPDDAEEFERSRYFSQRYSIFSWYDEGICLTDDAWFGVTPEPIAKCVFLPCGGFVQPRLAGNADLSLASQIAQDMSNAGPEKTIVIDAFAGAGGNTIAFALSGRWSRVIAIESDQSTLACAQRNALVNQVESGVITWVHADSFKFLETLFQRPVELHPDLRIDSGATFLFASPPWGGQGYRTDKVFDLTAMQPYNLHQLHGAYRRMDHALYLPRTSDIRQIARLGPEGRKVDVVQYCMEGASKAMVAYIPGQD